MISSYKLRIGDYDCWTVADGELTYPGSTLLPPESEVPEEVAVPYTALLIDTGSARILIDTGAGALGPHTGKLPRNLTALGFAPEAIDFVVLSHAHPDHIAGVARFPNARVVLMRNEFEFWTAAETQSKLAAGELYGLGGMEQLMAAYVNEHLPSRPNLCLLDAAAEIQSGILVFPASGHTPGHAAVLISSGREQLLYLGDAVIHPAQFEHPDWTSAFDLLRDQTVNTRKQLLDRAASDRCLIAGFHLPGAVGAVESWRGRFRWEGGQDLGYRQSDAQFRRLCVAAQPSPNRIGISSASAGLLPTHQRRLSFFLHLILPHLDSFRLVSWKHLSIIRCGYR